MTEQSRRPGTFTPGTSGNRNGRPRKSRTVDASLLKALQEPVTVTENGRRKRIAKLDVTTRQLVNKGAAGEFRATKLTLDMAQKAEERAQQAPSLPTLSQTDEEIVARFVARLRQTFTEETPHADA